MKHLKKILLLLAVATVGVIVFIFDNLTTIQEHVAFSAHKPVKHRIASERIKQDAIIPGELKITADIYGIATPNDPEQVLRPLLVVLHGGYWQGGNKKHYAHLAGLANKAGFITVIPDLPTAPGSIGRLLFSPDENILLKQARAIRQISQWLHNDAAALGGDSRKVHILATGTGATAGAQLVLELNDSARTLAVFNPILPVMTGKEKFDRNFIAPALQGLNDNQKTEILGIWQSNILKKVKIAVLYDEQEAASTAIIATGFAQSGTRVDVWHDGRPSPMTGLFRLGRKEEPLTDMLLAFWLDNN